MADEKTAGGTSTTVKSKAKTKKPRQYKVLLLNDDYTTMDFVVSILETVFAKSPAEAVQIMLRVHNNGRGLAGIYSLEIAEAKVELVRARAVEAGFPLQCVIEEE